MTPPSPAINRKAAHAVTGNLAANGYAVEDIATAGDQKAGGRHKLATTSLMTRALSSVSLDLLFGSEKIQRIYPLTARWTRTSPLATRRHAFTARDKTASGRRIQTLLADDLPIGSVTHN